MIAALALAIPISIQVMIDDLIPNLMAEDDRAHKIWQVALFGGLLIVVYLARVLFSWWRDYLAGKIGASIIADIRSGFFSHLQRIPLQFYQTHQIGEIMSRILADVHRIQYLLTSTLLTLLINYSRILNVKMSYRTAYIESDTSKALHIDQFSGRIKRLRC